MRLTQRLWQFFRLHEQVLLLLAEERCEVGAGTMQRVSTWCSVSVFLDGLEGDAAAGDFFEDGVGGCRPDEGLRVVVVDLDIVLDFFDQLRY